MKLSDAEVELLSDHKERKLWRRDKPHEIADRCYKCREEDYTVVDVRQLTSAAVRKTQGEAVFKRVRAAELFVDDKVWLLYVRRGDWIDRERYLARTGTPGDGHGYTERVDKNTMVDAGPTPPPALIARYADEAAPFIEERNRARAARYEEARRTRSARRLQDHLTEDA